MDYVYIYTNTHTHIHTLQRHACFISITYMYLLSLSTKMSDLLTCFLNKSLRV